MFCFANRLPNCKIIWSDILPRRNCIEGGTCAPSSESGKELVELVEWRSHLSMEKTANHSNIEFLEDGLFRVDRVHMSDVENAIITIITNSQSAIKALIIGCVAKIYKHL